MLFLTEIPTLIIGKITAMPSGIFCRAIPAAISIPRTTSPVPKPTPAAIPSGRLCRAIAIMNRYTLFVSSPAAESPALLQSRGVIESIRPTHAAPENKPRQQTNTPSLPPYSTDGRIRLIIADASITPAANAKKQSFNALDTLFSTRPKILPKIVAPPTPKAVIKTIFTYTFHFIF